MLVMDKEDKLKSDDIRQEFEIDYSFSDNDSEHDSDIGSIEAEQYEAMLEVETNNEEGDCFRSDEYLSENENGAQEEVEEEEEASLIAEEVDSVVEVEGNVVRVEDAVEEEDNVERVGLEAETEVVEEWKEWAAGDTNFIKFVWLNNSGYKPTIGQHPASPLEYFQLFFTDALLLEIVKETNRYANEKILKNTPLRKRSMWWSWKEVDLVEIKAFLGVIINMAMNPKPELGDYFSIDWIDYYPFFKDVFSK